MASLIFSQAPESSYEHLGRRIQQLIRSPHVQKVQVVDVSPESAESQADWNRLIEELEGTHGIRVDRLESGAVRIRWHEYIDC